ncbi:MAG: WhiB family transcriptional regulator [Mycobacterium sp.]
MQLQHCTETEARATVAALSPSPHKASASSHGHVPTTHVHTHRIPLGPPSLLHPEWRSDAQCRERPGIFFPSVNESHSSRVLREDEAKKLCQSCPALTPCRQFALDSAEPHGIWGATTPEERNRL